MKIGVVGVGNIAEKAYLPTYAKKQGTIDFYFATRNEATKQRLKDTYGFKHLYKTVDELIDEKIEACMIHAATKVHYELAKKCLENGIHVFIDKPLSVHLEEVHSLQKLAEQNQAILMVGFNRRFAPMVEKLKAVSNKRLIHLQKNRIRSKETTQFVIYDLFLHLVDTAVYLLDEPILSVKSHIRETEEYMELATMSLETANQTAILTMDLASGANTETYQVTSKDATYELSNLTDLVVRRLEKVELETFGDWTTTLDKRGFAPMVQLFFSEIQQKNPDKSNLKQVGIEQSHALCEEMLTRHARHQL
ncbi:virulence factor [Enterococcus sp. 10A9_DIV0425]|uniref:Virulence factor n=1 Tax=Candidatus Enterococcus wittei TaxID=1987383 RepID=A0A242JXP9_9ENTE|nr:Gfo/Idh/MocA family oxidoreductase [Enterococcus sp. 10A9_DIV0425]OTP10097.1 virulence factor [Enterococcus sp. 10A9_DIV0425]